MNDVVVVGAGAAGMMAAFAAAGAGSRVTVLERNRYPGRKLLLTGKGRCNITNATEPAGIVNGIPGNGRFLTGVLHRFTPDDLMNLLERHGVPLKVERGRRVFPASDKSSDVVRALGGMMQETGANVLTGWRVCAIRKKTDGQFTLHSDDGRIINADHVILATGGCSYSQTGSSGDGYRLAREFGHTVIPPRPSLVPLETAERWVGELQGLSLRNINARLYSGTHLLGEEFGEMLFTHFGISGPVVLSLSRLVTGTPNSGEFTFSIDLKPALDATELDQRVQRDFTLFSRKQFKNALDELLPQKLIPVMIGLVGIDPEKPVHQVTRAERTHLVALLKDLRMAVAGTRPLDEAIVTAGGINVKEIDPRTMESTIVPGLFFAGEVIDVDGYTGGYNLQAAFSTGYAAGLSAAGRITG